MLERSILGSKADADALVTTKDGALVVIFAAPDRNAIDGVIERADRRPAAAAGSGVQLRRTAAVGPWRMGVGRAHQGPAGVRLSFEQARRPWTGRPARRSATGAGRGGPAAAPGAGPRRGRDARVGGRRPGAAGRTPGAAPSRCCAPWRRISLPAVTPRSARARCTCRCAP